MENVRSLEILRYISREGRPASLREVAEGTGLSRSTALRILDKLSAEGWLIPEGRPRRYRASMRVVELGLAALKGNAPRDEIVPYVFQAARDLELCSLNFYEAGECIVTDVIQPFGATFKHFMPGNRVPAGASAAGKVLLAHRPLPEIESVIAKRLPQFTDLTRTNTEEVRCDIEEARRRGFGINRGEYASASPGIAVPVFDANGRAVAAIGARIGFPVREDPEFERRLRVIRQASDAASHYLGYLPSAVTTVT